MPAKKSTKSSIKILDKNGKVRMYACPMEEDERMMRLALDQAKIGASEGEVPVGAVLTAEGRVVATGHNSPVSLRDPSAHAEISVIRKGAAALGNYRLPDTTLYVTLEPCIMCAGAIIQARIGRLVFGASDPKGGAVVSLYRVLSDGRLNHTVKITGGILEDACAEILSGFFRRKRL